jgi:hypothetical protein
MTEVAERPIPPKPRAGAARAFAVAGILSALTLAQAQPAGQADGLESRAEGQPRPEAQPGAPRLLFVGVEVGDAAANNDGWMEPGETVDLKIKLYNDGNELATSVFGVLDYLGTNPDVTIPDKTATWPNLVARGAPALTDPPHFQVQLASTLACGAVLPFRLAVTTGTGQASTLDFDLKVGQRLDHDMIADTVQRFTEQEATFSGADPSDTLGGGDPGSVTWGDINGDGYADLILGARAGDSTGNSRVDAGEVYLIYGKATQWTDIELLTPPAGMARFWGADPGDLLGSSVASGDLNGDGFDDLILGARAGDSTGNSRVNAGEVYLIYGKATQWNDTDLLSPPAGVARFWGVDAGDELGRSVASGDANGDGFDDLILGVPRGDSTGNSRLESGEVYLVYGMSTQWTDRDLLSPLAGVARFWGAEDFDDLGWSVASGDLNGDGFDDLILGAILGDSTGNSRVNAGEVYLVYGKATQWNDTDLLSPPAGVARFWGVDEFDQFGRSVASGDFNGDGFDDLILGAPGGGSTGNSRVDAGEVYLVYGKATQWNDTDLLSPSAVAARFWGADAIDILGSSVASGDLDGDGFDDLILGATLGDSTGNSRVNAGEVYLVHGKATQWTDTDLLSPPAGRARFWGADAGDQLGSSVASGDLNGDGFDDLILGAPLGDSTGNTRSDAGEVYLWYGKPRDTYYARADTFAFIDASAGTKLALACDDCSIAVPIGFSFPFYGEEFTTLHVSSNGLLSFAPLNDLASANPVCIPARNPDNLLIAPFWDDLNPEAGAAGSGVFTFLQGTAPNRRLTIEWKDVPHYPNTGTATFEATLFESTGQILFQHLDLDFGSASFDNGAAAVAGVENRKGAHGVAYSCQAGDVLAAGSAVRMIPTTPLVENRAEHGAGLWATTGLWHLNGASCEPNQHTGTTAWYYGQDGTCNFDTGGVNSGSLLVPTMPAFPDDARLAFWYRRKGEGGGFDRSLVQLSTSGTLGIYNDILQIADATATWKYAGVTNLFGNAGNTVDLRFFFNSVDGAANDLLGWMVDDVQIVGCNAVGAPAMAASATAYAQPDNYCEGTTGLTDALGSFCGDSGSPSTYQWKEDGAPIPGATGVTHTIPASHASGEFDFTVAIGCPGGALDESDPAAVRIVAPPANVGPTLTLTTAGAGADLVFNWADAASAEDYVVLLDTVPSGSFATITGAASSGVTGLTVPMPPGNVLYFLVAGRNPTCGEGPRR